MSSCVSEIFCWRCFSKNRLFLALDIIFIPTVQQWLQTTKYISTPLIHLLVVVRELLTTNHYRSILGCMEWCAFLLIILWTGTTVADSITSNVTNQRLWCLQVLLAVLLLRLSHHVHVDKIQTAYILSQDVSAGNVSVVMGSLLDKEINVHLQEVFISGIAINPSKTTLRPQRTNCRQQGLGL